MYGPVDVGSIMHAAFDVIVRVVVLPVVIKNIKNCNRRGLLNTSAPTLDNAGPSLQPFEKHLAYSTNVDLEVLHLFHP